MLIADLLAHQISIQSMLWIRHCDRSKMRTKSSRNYIDLPKNPQKRPWPWYDLDFKVLQINCYTIDSHHTKVGMAVWTQKTNYKTRLPSIGGMSSLLPLSLILWLILTSGSYRKLQPYQVWWNSVVWYGHSSLILKKIQKVAAVTLTLRWPWPVT